MPIASAEYHRQRAAQLHSRVLNSIEPPIAELEAMFQEYLSVQAIPVKNAIPSDKDRVIVNLAVCAFNVIVACKVHFERGQQLLPCFLDAWPGVWRWLQFLDEECCQKTRYGNTGKVQALLSIATSVSYMSISKNLKRELQSTPGVVTMLARLWMNKGRYSKPIQSGLAMKNARRSCTGAIQALLRGDDQSQKLFTNDHRRLRRSRINCYHSN